MQCWPSVLAKSETSCAHCGVCLRASAALPQTQALPNKPSLQACQACSAVLSQLQHVATTAVSWLQSFHAYSQRFSQHYWELQEQSLSCKLHCHYCADFAPSSSGCLAFCRLRTQSSALLASLQPLHILCSNKQSMAEVTRSDRSQSFGIQSKAFCAFQNTARLKMSRGTEIPSL